MSTTYRRIVSDRSIPFEISEEQYRQLPEADKHKYQVKTPWDEDPIRDAPISRERQFEINDRKFYESGFNEENFLNEIS